MEARSRVVVAASTALALLVGAWWWLDHDAPPAPTPAPSAPATTPADSAPAAMASREVPSPGQPAASVPAAASEPTSRREVQVQDPKLATLRGRCVDEHGDPLAGCTVSLHGWGANSQRMDAWLQDHADKPEWQDPPTLTTAADGTFVFTFWPPPPFQFAVDLSQDGRGARSGRWSQLAEGSTKDVGDVVLSPGVRVTGRVVDEQGLPQDKERVSLQRRRTGRTGNDIEPRWGEQVVSKADGAFVLRGWLEPGEYELRTDKADLQSPKTVTLVAERSEENLTVVVRQRQAAEAITGRVLDDTGAPVRGVEIEDRSATGYASTRSARDGTFKLEQQRPDGGKHASLMLVSDQFEVEPQPRQVAWGTPDVEFRVRKAPSLTLRVTDEHGAPIDTYVVRLIPRNRGRWSTSDSEARAKGRHEDGTVVIPGLTRGDWLLMVDFPASSGLCGLFEQFTQDAGARRLDLCAQPLRRRTLCVVGPDGPIAGSKVQLCDGFGLPFDDDRLVMQRDHWLMNSGARNALVLWEGSTGADGRLELQGPGGRDLGLAVLGPGHIPLRLAPLRLEVTDELTVNVSRGASLVGKVVPPEALNELKRLAGAEPGRGFPEHYLPKLSLTNDHGGAFPKDHVSVQNRLDLRIADDGSFHLDGLPPGSWQVQVHGWITNGSGASGQTFPADRVTLVDGTTTTLDLDLSQVLPGELQGSVHCNGQPLANGSFVLQGKERGCTVTTDAEGRFRTSTLPGDYEAVISKQNSPTRWTRILSPQPVRVTQGQLTSVALVFESSTLRVTVLDPKGQPAAGVTIHLQGSDRFGPSLASDEHGLAEQEVTTGTVSLRVLPKHLSTPEGQQKLWQEAQQSGNQDPFRAHWIVLQTVTLVAGQTTAIELRLPESAGY
ncbi:MAG: hypothetical protein JNN13_05115 [Planctomycetes bacterium]|nr:hypothetical protein [Planctomycetota bacterium]